MGEDLAPNKQVLQRVVYRAGGPDVSQEAPLQIRTIFCAALPPPLKKLGERGEIGGWGDGYPSQLVPNHFGDQQQQSTITRQSKTNTNKWPSSTSESSEASLPPPRPSEKRRLHAPCVYSLHCQQHARATGCARPPAHTHTHRDTHTHTDTHTYRSGWGERQRETARASEKARDTPARAALRRPLRPGSNPAQPARERRSGLFMRRPSPPAAASSSPPSRARPDSRQQLSGLARGCVVCGLLPRRRGCHLPGRCPASPVAVSFFTLTLARGTSAPHAVPATSMPGRASTLLCSALLPGRRQQSFTPVAELGAAGRV